MRRGKLRAIAPLVALVALSGCAGGGDDEAATRMAEGFYASVAAKDGEAACARRQSTREALVQDEEMPCAKAVLSLKLSGSLAAKSTVWVNSAQVRLRRGDTVFLDETARGWRVAAAGCQPRRARSSPTSARSSPDASPVHRLPRADHGRADRLLDDRAGGPLR